MWDVYGNRPFRRTPKNGDKKRRGFNLAVTHVMFVGVGRYKEGWLGGPFSLLYGVSCQLGEPQTPRLSTETFGGTKVSLVNGGQKRRRPVRERRREPIRADHRVLVGDHRVLVGDHRVLVGDHRVLVGDHRVLVDFGNMFNSWSN